MAPTLTQLKTAIPGSRARCEDQQDYVLLPMPHGQPRWTRGGSTINAHQLWKRGVLHLTGPEPEAQNRHDGQQRST